MIRLTFLFFAVFNCAFSEAQNAVSAQKSISQNLLLHISKTVCNAGDSLKFKCFVINRVDHVQDDNNLYVILSDKTGKLISKDKYPIINSGSYGTMIIPKDLLPGIYNIQAFTPYMINNNIVKVNEIVVSNPTALSEQSEVSCKVYYDNNRLVSKMPNTFYIRTGFANDRPAVCEVILKDGQNNEQQKIFTDAHGVAKVTFVPLKNRIYSLDVKNSNKIIKVPLPVPDSNGVNMVVSYDSNIVKYKIAKNFRLESGQDAYTVTASQKNEVVYTYQFSFDDFNIVTGGLNVGGLRTGLLKLSLTNKDGIVVSSTQVYLQRATDFDPVTLNSSANPAGNKSHFDLSFSGQATSFVSISVENAGNADTVNPDDLDFFYTNPLNDPETNPVVDFYQVSNRPITLVAGKYKILSPNIRMLSSKGSNGELLPKLNDEYANIIRGKVYDSKNERSVSGGSLNISYYEKEKPVYFTIPVNKDGGFLLDSLLFSGKKKFYYRYFDRDNNELGCNIKLSENENNKMLDSLLVHRFNYKPALKTDNLENNDTKKTLLPEVKTKTEVKSKKQNINDLYTSGVYSGQSSAYIDNISNPPSDGSMPGTDFVKNRIPNIAFQNGNFVNTKNFSMGNRQNWIVGIVIDESSASLSDLNLLQAKDIALVKFFDVGHVAAGVGNPGGIVAVYTKNSKANKSSDNLDDKFAEREKSQVFEYEGFSNNVITEIDKAGDVKSGTVYWNPSVILRKGQNTYSFETEKPEPGKAYKLSLRGYNEAGQIINLESIVKY